MSSHTMPIWECPSCFKQQQADDYCDLESGDSMTCQFCEKEFEIAAVDTFIEIELKEPKP